MCFRPSKIKSACPKCGAEMLPGAVRCLSCGAELEVGESLPDVANPMARPAAPASPAAPEPPRAPGE